MTRYAPNIADSIHTAVTDAAATVALTMERGRTYLFVASVATWIAQGAEPTATAGAGSMLWPANTPLFVFGSRGAALSVLRASTNGSCSLTPVDLL